MSGAVFSYQWLANGADVAGATNDTYTPVADDVGKAIKVKVSFRDDKNHPESLTSAATAVVTAAADESAVWSATLTVGSIAGFRGFWKDVGMGELTSEVFTLDGVDYTVKVLSDTNGLLFDLTLDKALPVGFTLQVGATTLSSQDASIREYSSGATQYGWANQGVMLGGCGHRRGQPHPGRVTCRRAVGADNTVELGRTGPRPQGLKRKKGRIQSCAGGGHRIAVSSPVSCGLASRADRLPLLLHVERPLEHRVGGGLRLAAAALRLHRRDSGQPGQLRHSLRKVTRSHRKTVKRSRLYYTRIVQCGAGLPNDGRYSYVARLATTWTGESVHTDG